MHLRSVHVLAALLFILKGVSDGIAHIGDANEIDNVDVVANGNDGSEVENQDVAQLLERQITECNCGTVIKIKPGSKTAKKSRPSIIISKGNSRKSKSTNRIINGYVPLTHRPWLVFIKLSNNGVNGAGCILNKDYVLTAAHVVCFREYLCKEKVTTKEASSMKNAMTLVFGTKNVANLTEEHVTRRASEIYVHEGYIEDLVSSDIAVIKVDERLEFNEQEECVTKEPMPAGLPLCQKLVESGKYPKNIDRVYVTDDDENKGKLLTCNPAVVGKYGWCVIQEHPDTYDDADDDEDKPREYGFCQKDDCYSLDRVPDLHEAVLGVLNQSTCQELLDDDQKLIFNSTNEFCASDEIRGNISFVVFKHSNKKFLKDNEGFLQVHYYGGKDTCQGDSGGPAYFFKMGDDGVFRAHLGPILQNFFAIPSDATGIDQCILGQTFDQFTGDIFWR